MINLARRMRWVLAAGAAFPAPLFAQYSTTGPSNGSRYSFPAPVSTDPADSLAANLQILARNPRDLTALKEAGKSAIAVGDGNAALSFLARAEDLSPSDPGVKADLGRALLMLEQPDEALKLFSEATAMGYLERMLARDRGLAYDLTGQPRLAQKDYAAALKQGSDDETVRRMALSLGIMGDRDQGLKLLDPLLRKQDQAAWRARAFILAMNGNERDAERIVEQVTAPGMASTMSPFLRRLASLTPVQRARAVTFGTMPDSGVRTAMLASADPSFRPLDPGMASKLMPVDPPPAPVVTEEELAKKRKAAKAQRRRPGRDEQVLAARDAVPTQPVLTKSPEKPFRDERLDTRIDTRLATAIPAKLPPAVQVALGSPVKVAQNAPVTMAASPPSPPPPVLRSSINSTASDQQPSPIFEIPSAATAKPAPPPVIIREVALPPAPTTKPPITESPSAWPTQASVFAAPPSAPAPVIVSPPPSPPPPPPAPPPVQTVASDPAPSLVQMAVAPPPESLTGSGLSQPLTGPSRADAGLVPAAALPTPTPPVAVAQAEPAKVIAPAVGLSSIIAAIVPEEESKPAPLPTAAEIKAMRIAAQKKLAAETAAKAEKDAKAAAAAELAAKAKRNPARVWVQVATGSNEAGLPGTWKKLKEKAPDVFKGQSASVVPYKATNRVVVGPFKSQAEARAFVNSMGKAGIQGTTYSSEAGQEVARIGGK